MQYDLQDHGHQTLATIDIETTHYDSSKGEVVAIGIGEHTRGTPAANATYQTFYRDGDDEAEVIRKAICELNTLDSDALVSFNGSRFDLPFLAERQQRIAGQVGIVGLDDDGLHTDLFVPRKVRADAIDEQWPGLEDSLESYGLEPAVTLWEGEPVDNTRFGETLGPAYLQSLGDETGTREDLREVIEYYLLTDLEANLALYYHDIGEAFDPAYDGDQRAF